MSSSSRIIGPILPQVRDVHGKDESNDSITIGPTLPPGLIISNGKDHNRGEIIGPNRPLSNTNTYGPSLPTSSRKITGPVLPSSEQCDSNDSEDSYIGPKLCEATDAATHKDLSTSKDFERRAEKMKSKLLDKGPEVNQREEWMTELPNRLGPQIGMGPRAFKRRAPTGKEDDRSDWTDTPADRSRKMESTGSGQGPSTCIVEMTLHNRNSEISETLENYNKTKRKESLVDIHKKNRKRKSLGRLVIKYPVDAMCVYGKYYPIMVKLVMNVLNRNGSITQKDDSSMGRREFDRDKDLNLQRVDAAQAKSMTEKARLLGGRFSHGASHFL